MHFVQKGLRFMHQPLVFAQAQKVAHIVAAAPTHEFPATKTVICPHDYARLRPCRTKAFDQ
jgi:hypothetical protein